MSDKIKFGTDGWRAIIAKDYTVSNLIRVTDATARWILAQNGHKKVVVGHDCRFGGELFAATVAGIMAHHGIEVILAKGFVSTPMVSLGAFHFKADAGIIITASHNPPEYNGFKIKGSYGGPAYQGIIDEVEALIPEICALKPLSLEELEDQGKLKYVDLETLYCEHLTNSFDLKAIHQSKLVLAYDAMYGAGQNVIRRVMPEAVTLHCEHNPGFDGQAPEPIHKNLYELSELIRLSDDIASGLATDGDADRIGLYNAKGEFVDSHHIILLLIHYLHKHKGMGGKVINTFSCTGKIKKMCELYGLELITTKIGFKYICEYFLNDDVLVGGEESGGIAIKGHIPERDGIWIGMTIWEFMAKTGKSLEELVQEIYSIVGSFAVERYDLHLREDQKQAIIARCKEGAYRNFGAYDVERTEDLDGFKFHLGQDRWVMIRPSGTEPVLRVYAEAATSADAFAILDATKAAILD